MTAGDLKPADLETKVNNVHTWAVYIRLKERLLLKSLHLLILHNSFKMFSLRRRNPRMITPGTANSWFEVL